MHFEGSYELYAGSADVRVRTPPGAKYLLVRDDHFALRAQGGRDVRVPSKMSPPNLTLHHYHQVLPAGRQALECLSSAKEL